MIKFVIRLFKNTSSLFILWLGFAIGLLEDIGSMFMLWLGKERFGNEWAGDYPPKVEIEKNKVKRYSKDYPYERQFDTGSSIFKNEEIIF